MQYDEAYRPDKRIHDVYRKEWDASRLEKLGLQPYARIGSLADSPSPRGGYKTLPRGLNLHGFTFVSPLRGGNLSPLSYDLVSVFGDIARRTRKRDNSAQAAVQPLPAAVKQPPAVTKRRSPGLRWHVIMVPAIAAASVGLIVYAAAFQPVSKPEKPLSPPAHTNLNNSPYSPPLILDNNALFPLAGPSNGSGSNTGSGSQQAGSYYSGTTSSSYPTSSTGTTTSTAPSSSTTSTTTTSPTSTNSTSSGSGTTSTSSLPSTGSLLPPNSVTLPGVNL